MSEREGSSARVWQIGNCADCGTPLYESENSNRFPRTLPVRGERCGACRAKANRLK